MMKEKAAIKKVIITGATSMIGTSLIRYLMHQDIEVLAVCRKDCTKLSRIPKSPQITVCHLNLDELSQLPLICSQKYDAFFHLAWAGSFGSGRNDGDLQVNNVKYTLDAIKAAHQLGCKVFVGAGSQAEYGRTNEKLAASTAVNPETGYGISKYAAGKLGGILAEQLNIRFIWTRILSVYGIYDNPNSMVKSTFIKLMNNEELSFTKGEQLWDYLYCDDAAKALFLMAKYGEDQKVYPLGYGEAYPLLSYIYKMRDMINPNQKIVLGEIPYSEDQVMYLCSDIRELQEDTGFKPEISFEQGIQLMMDHRKGAVI